ncbi:hypothetical protein [Vibrio owensii]|uniref:hypothetical protein n=1 Tax=Vibrio owensii TaxID=696485 RepID=UPI0018F23EAB|nr:hypothetical protein [Vibrio owensii]
MEIGSIVRKFKINHRIITDTASHLAFDQAYRLFQRQNPLARTVAMFEEDGILQADGSLLYELQIPAKHNG